ncbi:MAG: hypothetical protein ACO3S1_08760, partial [Candidatus Puniceispirillaceae bacterium]
SKINQCRPCNRNTDHIGRVVIILDTAMAMRLQRQSLCRFSHKSTDPFQGYWLRISFTFSSCWFYAHGISFAANAGM